MQKIGDVRGSCSRCGWWGTVYEAEPDVDGDGSLGCPQCLSVVEFGAPNNSVQADVCLCSPLTAYTTDGVGGAKICSECGGTRR